MINYELGSQSRGGLKVLRKLITKGEVAQLLKMTKSQIRFYEKKGLIKPIIDDNGYAMYTFDHLDVLEMILLLKELDTPIKDIKKILMDESTFNYEELIQRSYDNIAKEMNRLKEKQNMLSNKLNLYKQSVVNAFSVDSYDERILYLFEEDMAAETTEKSVYDTIDKYKIDYLDPQMELCSIKNKESELVGVLNIEGNEYTEIVKRHTMEAGDYFSYVFSYNSNEDLLESQKIFETEAQLRNLKLLGDFIFIDHFGRKFYERYKVIGTFQKKIL